ncbi:MAG: hypothetical protein QOH04_738 [Sphingomonadales bacterium]|jgi:hypothetical protein|nr:hypothetical protein [Sphingomonadales bacterium]
MEQQPDSWAVSGRPSAASAECADGPDSSPGGGPSSAASADPAPPGISPPPPAAAAALDPDPTEQGAPPPGGYDPADYRWVPVRRRPRLDGWTEEKQRRFIEMLADSGLVSAAAKAVGMSRESAYRLRRSPHGAAFARAWDIARHHAGALVEDIAFERALEGVEHNVYDENGEVVCTKRVYNDRLLMFLLSHLKPERYAATARPAAGEAEAPPPIELEASLRAMEPAPPEPPERLLGPEALAAELEIADIADGKLPHFLSEQRPPKSAARIAAEARAAEEARGDAAWEKQQQGDALTRGEFADLCRHLDPTARTERSRRRFR